jgi:hypothetical protein
MGGENRPLTLVKTSDNMFTSVVYFQKRAWLIQSSKPMSTDTGQ